MRVETKLQIAGVCSGHSYIERLLSQVRSSIIDSEIHPLLSGITCRRQDLEFVEHAAVLFVIGIFGLFLNRKNVIILLMSIELMLLSVNINLVAFSSFMNDLVGQVFTLFVLTVAAAEAAIGLAILVSFFRNRGTIAVEDVNVMKG